MRHGTLVEEKRDAAGTHYRRARAYDPATGRFTQEDPIGLAGGVNLYGYAEGDPANFNDPFGLCPARLGGDGRTSALWDCPEGSSGFRMFHGANIESAAAPRELGSLRSLFGGGTRGAALSLVRRTAPTLPGKVIAREDGVTVQHYYRSGDHGPAHAHVRGGGGETRIGPRGHPLKGDPALTETQRDVVENNRSAIRRALNKIGRWLQHHDQ